MKNKLWRIQKNTFSAYESMNEKENTLVDKNDLIL